MTRAQITSHSFARHRQAVGKISGTLASLDSELRRIAKDAQLQPGDRARRQQEARAKAQQTIAGARATLAQAIAEDRQAARYADIPAGESLARRAYYQGAARTDLEGLTPDQAIVVLQRVVDSGDQERAREYVAAARPVLQTSQWAREYKAAELEAMAPEEKAHRVFAAGIEAVEAHLPWLNQWTEGLLASAGVMSEEARLGWEDEPPALDTRQVSLWMDSAERHAGAAGEITSAALSGREPAAWARHPERPASEFVEAPEGEEPGVASLGGVS